MVLSILQSLKIADAVIVGEILYAKGLYSSPHSARVNAQKKLNHLCSIGKLVRIGNYYRTLDCKSEYKEHARFVIQSLAELFKLKDINPIIHREITTPVGLRSDAIVLLTRDNQGLCLVLEVMINEPPSYFEMKQNTWDNWEGSLTYLSELFKYKIPHFEIVPITDLVGFKSFLEEVTR